jgi:hypothetical protein
MLAPPHSGTLADIPPGGNQSAYDLGPLLDIVPKISGSSEVLMANVIAMMRWLLKYILEQIVAWAVRFGRTAWFSLERWLWV